MVNRLAVAGLVFASLVAAACSNPTKDKPKAGVGEASVQAGAAQAPAPAGSRGTLYALTPGTSKIEFVGVKVTGRHEGSFERFKGTVEIPAQNLESARISVEIDMSSLVVEPEKLAGHLKSPDFFDVAQFPAATFTSSRIHSGAAAPATHTITGDFTLRGVTKAISFPATVTLTTTGLKATAEFSINRKDFGVVYPGMPDDLIRDEVLIKLTIDSPPVA